MFSKYTLLIACSLVFGCSNSGFPISVNAIDYDKNKSCWLKNGDRLSAFLVFAESGKSLIPYAVSSKCIVIIPGTKQLSRNFRLRALTLDDPSRLLTIKLGNVVGSSIPTDRPFPTEHSPVYAFIGSVTKYPKTRSSYSVTKVTFLSDTGMDYEHFLKLSLSERIALTQRFGL